MKRILKYFYNLFKKRKTKTISENTVGIITDSGYFNFGNRLQNFALRTKLIDLGYTPINIVLDNSSDSIFFPILKSVRFFINYLKYPKIFKKYLSIKRIAKKTGDVELFVSETSFGLSQLKKFKNVVLGSDQIWNYTYNKKMLPFNLGLYCSNNIISYAASLGTNKITDDYIEIFSNGLKRLKSIGVREIEAVNIMDKIGFDSALNCDPVFLINKQDWIKSITLYSKIKMQKEYTLVYILGENIDYRSYLSGDIQIINIMADEKYRYINHFDFIKLILNSTSIITDSYHCFLFALIFSKKIILIKRPGMESRFDTIFKIFQIESVYNQQIDLKNVNFDNIYDLKENSIKYLEDNLVRE